MIYVICLIYLLFKPWQRSTTLIAWSFIAVCIGMFMLQFMLDTRFWLIPNFLRTPILYRGFLLPQKIYLFVIGPVAIPVILLSTVPSRKMWTDPKQLRINPSIQSHAISVPQLLILDSFLSIFLYAKFMPK